MNMLEKELPKKTDGYRFYIRRGETHKIIAYRPEGVYVGHVWALFQKFGVPKDLLQRIHSRPGTVKMPGYSLYVTIQFSSGVRQDDAPQDAELISSGMLLAYVEKQNETGDGRRFLRQCKEPE